MAVPPRSDGKVWSGTVTYAASQPVELVVLHPYDASATDEEHGVPLYADLPDDGGQVAITLVKMDSGTPSASGSFEFTGTAMAFHTLDGSPFTVTYSVKAMAYQESN